MKPDMARDVYLNTASVGRISPESMAAANTFQTRCLHNPSGAFMDWMNQDLPALRSAVATLLRTSADQIAFAPNFSYSLLAVIQAVKQRVKKVLLYRQDYPSLNMPFELGGFDVVYIESADLKLQQIMDIAIREQVDCIAISHVQFLTGMTLDIVALGTFCKHHDIFFIVDATQSMGALNIDFGSTGADVLISSSYKWLNGGVGSAVVAVAADFVERFPPAFAGFGSMTHAEVGWSYEPSVLSYEPGHLNAFGLLRLQHAVEARLKMGVATVEAHNKALVAQLDLALQKTRFRPVTKPEERSNILCFNAGKEIFDILLSRGIVVTWRKGMIRVSPHFDNTEDDISMFAEVLLRC